MTDNGLKYLAEAKFDVDQLKANCSLTREIQLVNQLQDILDELSSLQGKYYNRRKDEVQLKSNY